MQQLAAIQAKRRNAGWKPIPAAVEPMAPAHEVLKRILSIRFLESDVEDWVLSASKEVPEAIAPYLIRNSQDEHRHDVVMQHLADYFGYTGEAAEVVGEWRANPSHPVVKACALEAGVFFVALPMLRSYGQGDIYANTVRQWVLEDESCHVATNRTIMAELGLKLNRGLLDLVSRTVAYLTDSVPGDQDRWLSRSRQTLISGRCPDLDEETVVSIPDQFTQRSRQAITYLNG